jgi:5-methyltetrahydropteroyltriglutamate--homocysteine methyltransferase
MQTSTERILTTHTGSLPRPPELTRLYLRRARGESVDAAELAQAGQRALRTAVARQIDCGIDVGNNGEQQREAFFLYLRHRLSGLGGSWRRPPRGDVERYPQYKARLERELATKEAVSNFTPPRAVGDIRYLDPSVIESECRDFRTALAEAKGGFVEPFLTAPSPGIVAAAMLNEHYADEESYLSALAAALKVEYDAILRHGFLLQLDCPDLALERHMTYRDRPLGEFLGFVERVIAAINRALADAPRERVRMHVCWGNYEGPHDCDVPLAEIWPLLRQAKVGAFVLPFANPRHAHETSAIAALPLAEDQLLVAGVIDTLTNFIEHPEVVADRIERAARAVGDPHRVIAGTDCGFDTSAGMGRVSEDIVWAKLVALRDGARLASKRLIG